MSFKRKNSQGTSKQSKSHRKGRYYLYKTRDYLKDLGYQVEIVEKAQRIVTRDDHGKPHVLFCKKDLWGGDLVARSKDELLWVQVKSNKTDISRRLKQLSEDDDWPPFVSRWVVIWEPRAKEPEIIEVVRSEEEDDYAPEEELEPEANSDPSK